MKNPGRLAGPRRMVNGGIDLGEEDNRSTRAGKNRDRNKEQKKSRLPVPLSLPVSLFHCHCLLPVPVPAKLIWELTGCGGI